eukprot:3921908-Rhodomonas_salina.1
MSNSDSEHVLVKPRARFTALQPQRPVKVTRAMLERMFCVSLTDASETLGICQTAIKKACRKFGIVKWPYRCPNPGPQKKVVHTASRSKKSLAPQPTMPELDVTNLEESLSCASTPSPVAAATRNEEHGICSSAQDGCQQPKKMYLPTFSERVLEVSAVDCEEGLFDFDNDPFWKLVPAALASDALADFAPKFDNSMEIARVVRGS